MASRVLLLAVMLKNKTVQRAMNRISILVILISITANTNALLLCDGDCANNTNINICQEEADYRLPIVLLGLFPCNTLSVRARGLTPAAQMAIRQISFSGKNPNLLPGYRLQLSVSNSMVSCTRYRLVYLWLYLFYHFNS